MQEGKDLFQYLQEDATVQESSAECSFNVESDSAAENKEPCKLFTIEKVLDRKPLPAK